MNPKNLSTNPAYFSWITRSNFSPDFKVDKSVPTKFTVTFHTTKNGVIFNLNFFPYKSQQKRLFLILRAADKSTYNRSLHFRLHQRQSL